MGKHTKGQWHTHAGVMADEFTIWSKEEKPIATQVSVNNADLIAAAPEMLKALERIAEEAAREARNIGDSARRGDQSKADTFRFIRDEALKVIKKAKGEK